MIGCLLRVLEVSRVMDDTEVPRILWVKCETSTECKTIRIAVSTVKDSWVTALGLRPHVYKSCVCVDKTTWVKSKDWTWLRWVGAHSIYVDICNLSSWLLESSWCMSYKLLNMSLHSKLAFCKIYLYHALLYLEPKHGLLASTFKVLIGLPLVILFARHERTGCDEEYFDDEHAS